MNKKFLTISPVILLIVLVVSCTRDANVKLPETPPKLVLVSFITPQDTIISVTVTYSQPLFESYDINTSAAVTNATVVLTGNSNSVQLTYDPNAEAYTIYATQFPIIAGNTYTLSVTTPNGDAAEATTTVPLHSGGAGFSITMSDTVDFSMGYYNLETQFDYSMTDYSGENNWYRFFSAVIWRDTITNDTTFDRYMENMYSDHNIEGEQVNEHLTGERSHFDPSDPNVAVGYDCWMFNVNDDYYKYHLSLYNFGGDDPFSEPTIMYTNVQGGLGVFAAANAVKVRIYR